MIRSSVRPKVTYKKSFRDVSGGLEEEIEKEDAKGYTQSQNKLECNRILLVGRLILHELTFGSQTVSNWVSKELSRKMPDTADCSQDITSG